MSFTTDELETCLKVLQHVADDPSVVDGHVPAHADRFKALVAKVHQCGRKALKRRLRADDRHADRAQAEQTAVVSGAAMPLSPAGLTRRSIPGLDRRVKPGDDAIMLFKAGAAPPHAYTNAELPTYRRPRNCYVCKAPFTAVHPFYHLLCPVCADFNRRKREQRADLQGRRALLTGGRIKIGHQLGLRLLRDGAELIVTTRFPNDARRRYAAEPDAGEWIGRLRIVGLDLRDLPGVEAFADGLAACEPSLDILINNAAQTIRRPLAFYAHLLAHETPALLEARADAALPALPEQTWFPRSRFDTHGQQIDLRPENSWSQRLHEVGTLEMLEVQLVNAVAPFVLASRLKPLFLRSPFARRFIVNVSAMEGQFSRGTKTARHPHTNMAKAALNMLTRTSAADYAADGIYMTSVDTGWITDEKPHPVAERVRGEGFFTPLDCADGVARVYDPVARGVNEPGEPFFGVFLKDYAPYPW
jgi:NAD(P)-dependent dehydrogenase (short-subunit alcohol dehydrogenase family)